MQNDLIKSIEYIFNKLPSEGAFLKYYLFYRGIEILEFIILFFLLFLFLAWLDS